MSDCPAGDGRVQRGGRYWKGNVWHRHCAERDGAPALGPPIAYCKNCGVELGHANITKTKTSDSSRPMLTCGHCGSQELTWANDQEVEVVY